MDLKHLFARQVLALQVLAAFFCLQVLGTPGVAHAQSPQGPPQVLGGARTIASPLFWADGLTRADELEAYQATGFNTVVVRLFWQPSPDGSLNPDDLTPQRQFAQAAAARGLKVIYALPPAPNGMEGQFRIAASSRAYFEVWTTWISGAMARLKSTPNLIGWMLPDDPRDLPYTDEVGWQRWLRENYANPTFLSAQWKSNYPSFDDASLQSLDGMLEANRGLPEPGPDFQKRLEALAARPPVERDPTWLFHPASLALAQYKWEAYRALLSAWADVIQQNDESHPIFSGRLPDYAQLLSLPPSISVSVPDLIPGVAEADALTHNPQAVAMARRGGRFKVIPTLLTRGSTAVAGEFVPQLTPRWVQSALLAGASGVSWAFWPDILSSEPLRASVSNSLREWRSDEWGRAPVSTVAVLMAPLADGVTLQIGKSLPTRARGLYGFGEHMIANEPSDLAYALRWGTAFGSVDFLSVDDLSPDGRSLARYSTVLMPCALSLSTEQTGALSSYVRSGGVLVADMGAGAVQAGGAGGLPPGLVNLFGIAPQMIVRRTSFDLSFLEPHPLLPSWARMSGGRVETRLTGERGQRGGTFAGLVGYPILLGEGARPIAMGDQFLQPFGPGGKTARPVRSALIARTQNGTAFFASWLLWTTWQPGHAGFDAFHGDLFARNAALAALGAPSLVPQPAGVEVPLWAPLLNYEDGVAVFNPNPQLQPIRLGDAAANAPRASIQSSAAVRPVPGANAAPRTAPGTPSASSSTSTTSTAQPGFAADAPVEPDTGMARGALAAGVQTSGVGDFMWSNALALLDPSAPFGVVGGRAAPVANADESERQPQPVSLRVLVEAGQAKISRLLPIRAQNMAGGPLLVHGARYDEAGIKLGAWPNTRESAIRGGDFAISLGEAAPVRLTFCSGVYAIAPGSRHRVTLSLSSPATTVVPSAPTTQRGGPTALPVKVAPRVTTQVLTADARGRFVVEATGAAFGVEVAPAN